MQPDAEVYDLREEFQRFRVGNKNLPPIYFYTWWLENKLIEARRKLVAQESLGSPVGAAPASSERGG